MFSRAVSLRTDILVLYVHVLKSNCMTGNCNFGNEQFQQFCVPQKRSSCPSKKLSSIQLISDILQNENSQTRITLRSYSYSGLRRGVIV